MSLARGSAVEFSDLEERVAVVNIFVGNLAYGVTDRELRGAFEAYGQVASASVIIDRATNKSRGFGFVEMPNREEANAAIQALNQQDLGGRPMRVNEARPKEDRPPRRDFDGAGARGGFGGGRGDRGDRGFRNDRY
jgi:cold-inducible RNA-binding protein